MAKTKVHIVSYTHWDREFRWEFERTRMRLVDCIDHLLDIMENDPDYRSFMLDGQMTLLEDYLEIRPENRDRILKLAQEGRLELGPWFTLPDCSPINGESIIRNLKFGMKQASQFGNVMKCGYNVFSFGQIGQLPQIYNNFGIDTIIFYKYMDPQRSKYQEFIWEAPDGSRALASRLGREARWNFFFAGHIPIVYDRDPWNKDWQYRWGDLGKVFHTADPDGYSWFYDIVDPETSYHSENIENGMERALETVAGTAAPEVVLFFDGTDFTEPHPLTSSYIKELQKKYADKFDIIHSTLSDYLDELKSSLRERQDLDVISGPMRDGPVGAVHSDVISTHPEIPIANSHAENTIVRWAEPLSTITWKQGIDRFPKTYLEKAWKLLFQSHAHDSLHGLGPVTLVDGELGRLEQAHIIGQGLERKALGNITKEIDTQAVSDTDYFLTVYNPSSFIRDDVVEAFVDIPADIKLVNIILEDTAGNPVQVQEVSRENTRAGIYHPRSRNMPFYSTRVRLFFKANGVPALGYKVFKLKWAQKDLYPYPHEDWDAPRIYADNLLTGPNQAENDYISLKINNDGTFDLTDKATGHCYPNQNYFLDQGEIGNMWMSDVPGNSGLTYSTGTPAEISATVQGPLAVTFSITKHWSLPAEFNWQKQQRSDIRKDLVITTEVTLRKGAQQCEVVTTVNNSVKDHYLKVCFPTRLNAEYTWAEGAFSVTKYPVKPSTNGELRGNELARHPAQLWFDLSDGHQGLAVLSDAAKDYEILEHNAEMTMAMGLVRSTRLRIPCDNRLWMEYPGDESAQALKTITYRYALMPHAGEWNDASLYEHALTFTAPLQACQFGKQQGTLPLEKSFVQIDGKNVILSAVKKADDRDSVIVRFFNPSEEDTEASFHIGFACKEAYINRLNEERGEKLPIANGMVTVNVPKGKIMSIEFA
ncbi:MAG TPA: glycoside hydrolase family 38 C-terminal domain-containing protein [Armatimonadota bacterium]|nr:glycoside hydrolase family 38 C-terminal domain-containing protein [Armatimonadota bacterium]